MPDQPQMIVCEKGNRWAVALRWVLQASGVRVYETRTWQAALEALETGRSSVLAAELRRGNLSEVVRGIVRARQQFPDATVLVLAERGMAEAEWTVREAGAVHFTVSPRDLAPVARLATRALATDPQPVAGIGDSTLQRLPWGE